jgi:CheY-like chemotaxis protein
VAATPLREDAGPPAPATGRTGLERGGETVLLVEDDLVVRESARRLLGELGYRVLAARDAEEAMRTCEGGDHPDLVFTDLVMPGMNGLDLAARVQVRCPSARILLTSGHAHDVLTAQGAAEIDLPFLAKPYTPAALAAKIRSVLDVPAASRQPSA